MFHPAKVPVLLILLAGVVGCTSTRNPADAQAVAESKAVGFLIREVPAWSRENGCYSCHNNGDGARALYAASRKGYSIARGVLKDTTIWVENPAGWEHNKGEPGFSDQRLADLQFSASLLAAIETGWLNNRTPLFEASEKLLKDQNADGSWLTDQHTIGSPATYGSPLATYMALKVLKVVHGRDTTDAVVKATRWLVEYRPQNTLDIATMLSASREISASSISAKRSDYIGPLRKAQTHDGGWGPYPDSPAEVFDTAVVLLALAPFKNSPEFSSMIMMGREFLTRNQETNGSWPPTTRPSGGNSYAQRISTTGWAALALMETRN